MNAFFFCELDGGGGECHMGPDAENPPHIAHFFLFSFFLYYEMVYPHHRDMDLTIPPEILPYWRYYSYYRPQLIHVYMSLLRHNIPKQHKTK